MARVDTTGVTGGFERMEEKVRTQEARAKATAELDHDSVDERFKQLEQSDTGRREHMRGRAVLEVERAGQHSLCREWQAQQGADAVLDHVGVLGEWVPDARVIKPHGFSRPQHVRQNRIGQI